MKKEKPIRKSSYDKLTFKTPYIPLFMDIFSYVEDLHISGGEYRDPEHPKSNARKLEYKSYKYIFYYVEPKAPIKGVFFFSINNKDLYSPYELENSIYYLLELFEKLNLTWTISTLDICYDIRGIDILKKINYNRVSEPGYIKTQSKWNPTTINSMSGDILYIHRSKKSPTSAGEKVSKWPIKVRIYDKVKEVKNISGKEYQIPLTWRDSSVTRIELSITKKRAESINKESYIIDAIERLIREDLVRFIDNKELIIKIIFYYLRDSYTMSIGSFSINYSFLNSIESYEGNDTKNILDTDLYELIMEYIREPKEAQRIKNKLLRSIKKVRPNLYRSFLEEVSRWQSPEQLHIEVLKENLHTFGYLENPDSLYELNVEYMTERAKNLHNFILSSPLLTPNIKIRQNLNLNQNINKKVVYYGLTEPKPESNKNKSYDNDIFNLFN